VLNPARPWRWGSPPGIAPVSTAAVAYSVALNLARIGVVVST